MTTLKKLAASQHPEAWKAYKKHLGKHAEVNMFFGTYLGQYPSKEDYVSEILEHNHQINKAAMQFIDLSGFADFMKSSGEVYFLSSEDGNSVFVFSR